MVWQLLALHAPDDDVIPLPCDGDATIGRRPNNFLVCPNLAVSGTHCIVHCSANCPPEFEDCSTNGSFVNERKLQKGQKCQLADGDVISLTKPLEAVDQKEGAEPGPRVQYKLVLHEEPRDDPCEIPPTAPDPKRSADERSVEPCFAQDLLVQEQQSKAKLTADLLVSQRKLDEERQSVESLSRELRKVRQQAEEERARRQEAEEARSKLSGEVEALRTEARQLNELTAAHEDLRGRHATSEKEFLERGQRCEELEAQQQKLRQDLALAGEAQQKSSQQLAELQIRAKQAQERAERLRQQQSEAQREAERSMEETQRVQEELQAVVAGREKLEGEVASSKAAVAKAEAEERSARNKLDVATAKRAELECQAAAAQSDADSARISVRAAETRAASARGLAIRLTDAGRTLGTDLTKRLELWDKVLQGGLPEAAKILEDALAGDVAPTFAQATCREEPAPDAPAAKREAERSTSEAQRQEPCVAAQPTVAAMELENDRAQDLKASDGSAFGHQPQVGFSTAWSLEVVDVEPQPPRKKLRKEG